jgi:protein-S-isoprenylcysteine O-methyltransferase Ste14
VIAGHVLYAQRQVFTGFLLLLARRTLAPPRSLKDVLVPLAVSFFYFSYEAIPWLPALLQKNLCPVRLQTFFTFFGLFLNLMGLTVALCSVASLGRSFGVFIEVKNIVTNGTYRWARHPMYSGYICLITGIGLVNFSLAYFILVPINVALISYRAGLEEERLSEYSPEYREYRSRTGRFFPKFRQLWMG